MNKNRLLGKPVAEKIYQEIGAKLANFESNNMPSLAVILVGEDPVSLSYVKAKEKIAEKLGFNFKLYHLPKIAPFESLLALIDDLDKNKFIDGIMIQLPLPKEFDTDFILKKVAAEKDIDGFFGNFTPPTAEAILEILNYYNIDLQSKKIVIVGYGRLVGKPLSRILEKKGLEYEVCDSKTTDLENRLQKADIVISATGATGLVKSSFLKEGAVVVDAGSSEDSGQIKGDLEIDENNKNINYTPNPGGVGPVTVACLMRNLVKAKGNSN